MTDHIPIDLPARLAALAAQEEPPPFHLITVDSPPPHPGWVWRAPKGHWESVVITSIAWTTSLRSDASALKCYTHWADWNEGQRPTVHPETGADL